MQWHVIFRPPIGKPRWWTMFTGWQFGHVLAFAEIAGRVVVVDPGFDRLGVDVMETTADELLPKIFGATAIVRFDAQAHPVGFAGRRCTCVSAIKSLMGIRTRAITPKQLYKWLLLNGGVAIQLYERTNHG